MKLIFGFVSVVASVAAAQQTQSTAQCNVIPPHTTQTCDGETFSSDPTDVSQCGDPAEAYSLPCHALIDPQGKLECGKCYLVRYSRDDIVDPAVCKEGGCPGYTRDLFVRAVGQTGGSAEVNPSHGAWEHLCPFVCFGSDFCVTDESHCVHGAVPAGTAIDGKGEDFSFPGSCAARSQDVITLEIYCGDH